ncbi:MAG: flagellar export protein FliJ [Lachnospiraceae bacterium]|nr:flagellar export protein FliJ [Lachnospiraceae bacterium]
MSKFIYRMQNILDLKEKLETQARMAYASQRAVLNREEEKRDALIAQKEQIEQEIREMSEGSLRALDLKHASEGITTMKYLIADQEKAVLREERILNQKRSELEEVMKERKAQEKLREKAFAQFLKDENAAESKMVDELTSYSFGAKRSGNV